LYKDQTITIIFSFGVILDSDESVLAESSQLTPQNENTICIDETKSWELVAETFLWENLTVTPAIFGLPKRVLLA
jgi:hypothetical protein